MWSLTLDEVWKSLAFGKNPWLVTSKALFVRANHSPADSSAESASGGGRGGPNRLNATRYCRSSAELVNRIFRKSAVSINLVAKLHGGRSPSAIVGTPENSGGVAPQAPDAHDR